MRVRMAGSQAEGDGAGLGGAIWMGPAAVGAGEGVGMGVGEGADGGAGGEAVAPTGGAAAGRGAVGTRNSG